MAIASAVAEPGMQLYDLTWWHNSSQEWPIFPLLVEETKRNQKRSIFKMKHSWLMLTYMVAGSHRYEMVVANMTIQAGEICIIPPDTEYICRTDTEYHKLVIMIDGSLLTQTCEILHLDRPQKITVPEKINIEKSFRYIVSRMKDETKENVPEILGQISQLLSELSILTVHGNFLPDYLLFSRIKKRLGSKLDQRLILQEVASELNISRSLLHKLFIKYAATSPQQYRIAKKMARAEYCLLHTELSIKEIAFQLGYSNQNYFSNDFKRHYLLSPRLYRKNRNGLRH